MVPEVDSELGHGGIALPITRSCCPVSYPAWCPAAVRIRSTSALQCSRVSFRAPGRAPRTFLGGALSGAHHRAGSLPASHRQVVTVLAEGPGPSKGVVGSRVDGDDRRPEGL